MKAKFVTFVVKERQQLQMIGTLKFKFHKRKMICPFLLFYTIPFHLLSTIVLDAVS